MKAITVIMLLIVTKYFTIDNGKVPDFALPNCEKDTIYFYKIKQKTNIIYYTDSTDYEFDKNYQALLCDTFFTNNPMLAIYIVFNGGDAKFYSCCKNYGSKNNYIYFVKDKDFKITSCCYMNQRRLVLTDENPKMLVQVDNIDILKYYIKKL